MKLIYYSMLIFYCYFTAKSNSDVSQALNPIMVHLDTCLSKDIKSQLIKCDTLQIEQSFFTNCVNVEWSELWKTSQCLNETKSIIKNSPYIESDIIELFELFSIDGEKLIRQIYLSYLKNEDYIRQYYIGIENLEMKKMKSDSIRLAWLVADSINSIYIPKDINDALSQLTKMVSQAGTQKFKNYQNEAIAINEEHLNIGMGLRNAWKLSISRLWKYFADMGITNQDNISSVILKCWYRQLNNKPIEFEKEIEALQKEQREINQKGNND